MLDILIRNIYFYYYILFPSDIQLEALIFKRLPEHVHTRILRQQL